MSTDTSAENSSSIQSEHDANGRALSCIQVFFKQLFVCKSMGSLQVELATTQGFECILTSIKLLAIALGNTIGE